MCWQVFVDFSLSDGFVEKQLRQSTSRQPGKTALVHQTPKCKPTITVQAMPAEANTIEMNTCHGFHWIAKDPLDLPDLFAHLCPRCLNVVREVPLYEKNSRAKPQRRKALRVFKVFFARFASLRLCARKMFRIEVSS